MISQPYAQLTKPNQPNFNLRLLNYSIANINFSREKVPRFERNTASELQCTVLPRHRTFALIRKWIPDRELFCRGVLSSKENSGSKIKVVTVSFEKETRNAGNEKTTAVFT